MTSEERSRLIESQKVPSSTGTSIRLWCKDEYRTFPVFRVPVDALLLNAENRRFVAERTLFEAKLGHSLDPENSADDEASVVSILLDQDWDVEGNRVIGKPSRDAVSLKADWLKRKQETPFWIRPDGRVRNGNRRLALLKRLRAESGLDGTQYVDAVILEPSAINEADLFEMEQREQLTENLKVRYTDINLLLTLREAAIARGVDWFDDDSLGRVAGELQTVAGGDKTYALIQLKAIRFMDAYLADSDAPGEYHKLFRQVERFRDIGKSMTAIEKDYADHAPDMLRLLFAAIRAKATTHDDIRKIRKMFVQDRSRFDALLREVEKEEASWSAASEPRLGEPDLSSRNEDDDENEDDDSPPGPGVPGYPAERVSTRISDAIDGMMSAQLSVSSILQQIVSRIDTLDRNSGALASALEGPDAPEVLSALEKVLAWSERMRAGLTPKA
jgi:hypothetical protein